MSDANPDILITENREGDIWKQILEDSTKKDQLSQKSLLVIGSVNSGKSSLLSKIQGIDLDNKPRTSALEYTYIDVFSDDSEDDILSRINVWQLDIDCAPLLIYGLNEENISDSVIVITLDFSDPWNLENALLERLNSIEKHINSLKLSVEESENLKQSLIHLFVSYGEEKKAGKKNFNPDLSKELLPEGCLTNNLGIPIIVVCCKLDVMNELEDDYGFRDDHFEFIQQRLRSLCLRYGAGLIYTSSKTGTNCKVFFEYLQHIFYGMEYNDKPEALDKTSIFIPIGWDTPGKIQSDFQNQKLTSDPNATLISVLPQNNNTQNDEVTTLITTEDDEQFLQRLYMKSQDSHEFAKMLLNKFGSMTTTDSDNASSIPHPSSQSREEMASWFESKMKSQKTDQ